MELLKYINDFSKEKEKFESIINNIINDFIFREGYEPTRLVVSAYIYQGLAKELSFMKFPISRIKEKEFAIYRGIQIVRNPAQKANAIAMR